MSTLTLGQRVDVTHELRRIRTYPTEQPKWAYRWVKTWTEFALRTPVTGIVVGVRTLSDGHADSTEDGTSFTATARRKAVLVVTDLRRKPMIVPFERVVAEVR